jgi:protein-tyrosine phosphatase
LTKETNQNQPKPEPKPKTNQKTAPGAWPKIAAVFDAVADAGGGRKAVTHCTGGVSRAGLALAAWLVHRHGLSGADAGNELAAAAAAAGVKRTAPAPEKLEKFMAGQEW